MNFWTPAAGACGSRRPRAAASSAADTGIKAWRACGIANGNFLWQTGAATFGWARRCEPTSTTASVVTEDNLFLSV
jgi:hypothetical protein